MRRIRRLFGNTHHRKARKTQQRSATHRSRFTAQLEALEQRRLLSANPLDFALASVVDGTKMELNVAGGSASTVLALRVSAENGSALNPATPVIETLGGVSVAPIYSTHNMAGSNDSLLLAELGPGTYSITIKTEAATAGDCRIDVLLPGDISGNGFVEEAEYMQACAAAAQDSGPVNSFTARYYSTMGFNLNVDQYHPALDVDGDGVIDGFDLNHIHANVGVSAVFATVTANENPEFTPPAQPAEMAEDSGTLDVDLWDYVADAETADADLTFADVTSPQGVATLDADGHTVHFTPAANYHGTAQVGFSVTDVGENGAKENREQFTLDIVVTPVNDAPLAKDDAVELSADTTVAIDVLDNDVDIDAGDVLSIVEPLDEPAGFEGTLSVANGRIVFDPSGSEAIKQLEDGQTLVQTFDYAITDADGLSDTATVTITVVGVNDPPQPLTPATVEMAEDSGTIDVDLWDYVEDTETADAALTFADVTSPQGVATLDADGHTVHFTPATNYNGTATISFAVTDTANNAANVHTVQMTAAITVTPVNDLPAIEDATTVQTDEDTTIDIDLRTRISDIETADDELEFLVKNPTGGTVSLLADGHTARFTPAENHHGPAGFDFDVTDGGDGAAAAVALGFSVAIDVAAVNDAPSVEEAAPAELDEDTQTTVDLRTRVVDIETADVDLVFNLEDPNTHATPATVINKPEGTLELLPNAGDNDYQVRFTPAADFEGLAAFEFWATDSGDGTAAAITENFLLTFSVAGVNDPPTAVDDADSTNEDTPTTIDVLDNDTDADTGDTKTVQSLDTTGTLGTVTNNGTDVTYDPNGAFDHLGAGQSATDTFTYTMVDGQGVTSTATVTVTITGVNDPPVAVDDADSTDEDAPTTIDVLDNDTDADTPDTKTVQNLDTTGTLGTVTNNGTDVTYDPNGAFDHLGVGQSATDTFTYTMVDGQGVTSTATVTVTITGVNDPPLAVDATFTIKPTSPDGVVVGTVSVDDVDVGDTHKFAITASDPAPGTTLFEIDEDTGVITAVDTGALTYDTSYNLTVEVTDLGGTGATDTATITINVVENQAPQAKPDEFNASADAPVSGNVLVDNGHGEDSDPESDAISVTTTGTAIATSKGGLYWLDAAGDMTYDPNGAFDDLGVGQTATDTFDYTIEDIYGGTSTTTVTVTITGVNDPPTAVDDADSTDEDTPVTIDVLDNDTDPDTGDTKTVQSVDTTGTLGTVTNNGTDVTYDPNGAFDYLGVGQSATDTFTYTMVDGQGETSTATVTVTVTGVNDPPTAVDDADSTDDDTPLTIDVLDNDTDADTGDSKTVQSVDTTGTLGTVTNNGTDVTYDPNGAFDYLGVGQSATDTFTYTMVDGQGETSTATVTVTVINDDPYVANEITDLIISDDHAQPITYDLSTVFADDDPLSYTASSSNSDLVQVEIIGSTLSLTYAAYESDMDRTPAEITVTATEIGGNEASVSEEFTVTVLPEQTLDVQLVVLDAASSANQLGALPESITDVDVGQSYVVEIWMQDTLDSSATSGPVSDGLNGAYFNINFEDTLGEALSIDHASVFTSFTTGTIDNDNGLIEDFGGATIDADYGIGGNYVRLGYVEFQATDTGTQEFTLDFLEATRFSSSALVTGHITEDQVSTSAITVSHNASQQEITTFDLTASSNIIIGGVCYGEELVEQDSLSDVTDLIGTIDAILTYDNSDNITGIEFVGASIVAENIPFYEFAPGEGGTAGTDPANAGLKSITEAFNLALRNLALNITSAAAIPVSSTHIDQGGISYTVAVGTFDLRTTGGASMSESLAGKEIYEDTIIPGYETTMGSIIVVGNTIELNLSFEKFVDISDITGTSGDYLTFNTVIDAEHVTTALTATQTAQDTTSDDRTDVVMTLSTAATAIDADGQVAVLPQSEAWIDEWDGYWVEIWARSGQGAGINAAKLDLSYNGDYFTAVEIQHGPAFSENAGGDIAVDGLVSSLGGEAATAGLGSDAYVLLARVRFESTADDQVPIDADNLLIGPHDLGLELSNVEIELDGVAEPELVIGPAPATELWAVPYDLDDSDRIDLGDLAFFAQAYRSEVLTDSDSFAWASDYDKSGYIDLGDLSFFAANYRRSKQGDSDILYPKTFLQRWTGSELEAEGDATVAELLDAAVDSWADVLGMDEPIDVQLVVKDFGTDQLGEAEIVEVDATTGLPSKAVITIDDDAAGMGWYAQLDGMPGESQYDLYTVLLHEVGHALGFTTKYDAFAYHVQSDGQDGTVFVAGDLIVELDNSGQHIEDAAYADDLMSATLSPGVRKLPSAISAEMLTTAYATAAINGSGFSGGAAAMHAEGGSSGPGLTLAESSACSCELSPPLEQLAGDMTWQRLSATPGLDEPRAAKVDEDGVDLVMLDALLDDINSGDFISPSPSTSKLRGNDPLDAAELALCTHAQQPQRRLAEKKSDDDLACDAILTAWCEPWG